MTDIGVVAAGERSGRCRRIADVPPFSQLSAHGSVCDQGCVPSYSVCGSGICLPIRWTGRPSRLGIPIGTANCVYASTCCWLHQTRKDGRMFFGKQQVNYVVEQDNIGRDVLPEVYLGVTSGNRVEKSETKDALKLRLDARSTPMTVQLWNGLKT